MSTPVKIRKAWEKIIVALTLFDYLTAYQLARLLYSPASISRVRKELKSLAAASLVLSLGGRAVNLPLVYTLSSKGRQSAASLGVSASRRLRPSEEKDKGYNPYFLKHTIAVTDVLIAAQLLSRTVPHIELTRMLTERELKRKIYVELPEKVCIEPDASCEFLLTETWHNPPQTWKDFFTSRSTAICRLRSGGSSKRLQGMLPMPSPGNIRRYSTHQHSPLPLLPQRRRWQQRSNAGLKKRYRQWGGQKQDTGFSFAILIPQQQARKICFFHQSGSRRLVVPKHRCLCYKTGRHKMAVQLQLEEK
jgi:hypothetical protein